MPSADSTVVELASTSGALVTAVVFARGGPEVTTRSQFLKTADVFRTGLERNDYDKTGKSGELSKPKGETKVEKTVKPQRGRK